MRSPASPEFQASVQPLASMLNELADHGFGFGTASRNPAADSPAMAELDQQAGLSGPWDAVPIDTAFTHVGLLLTAGEDAMRAFATLVTAPHPPAYAYVPVARAGLECLALAYYLGEAGIGARERVRRSLNERIASAWEQERLPSEIHRDPDVRDRLYKATSIGFELTKSRKGRLKVFEPDRPTTTHHIQKVLTCDELGKSIYSYTSAISHGVLWGLVQPVESPADVDGPVAQAAIVVSTVAISQMAIALAMAHLTTFHDYASLMGWQDDQLEQVRSSAFRVISGLLDAQEPSPAPVAPTDVDQYAPDGLILPEPGHLLLPVSLHGLGRPRP